jgi:hypothetical protein
MIDAKPTLDPQPMTVSNKTFTDLDPAQIDMIVAACGYEPRCTKVVQDLQCRSHDPQFGRRLHVFRFSEHANKRSRIDAEAAFAKIGSAATYDVSAEDAKTIRRAVFDALQRPAEPQRNMVVVDYTAMPRVFYLGILDMVPQFPDRHFVFTYALGVYGQTERQFPISCVGTPRPVPGYEGLPLPERRKIYVFGLGFDGVGARALKETLEAERLAVFWAQPGATETSAKTTLEKNEDLISQAVLRIFVDIRDVTTAVQELRRLSHETKSSDKVIFVPVGPKPHILAAGIVTKEFSHCSLIAPHARGGGTRSDVAEVRAGGAVVCTSIRAASEFTR